MSEPSAGHADYLDTQGRDSKERRRRITVMAAVVALLVVSLAVVALVVRSEETETGQAVRSAEECKEFDEEPYAPKDDCEPWVGMREKLADLKMPDSLTLVADHSTGFTDPGILTCSHVQCAILERHYTSPEEIEPTCHAVADALKAWGAITSAPSVTITSVKGCSIGAQKSGLILGVQVHEGHESPVTGPHRSRVFLKVQPFRRG